MPGPYDNEDARVRVSTTENGTYTNIGYVRRGSYQEGSDGASKTKYLGGEIQKAGDPNLSGTVDVVYNREDTNGQAVLKTAKRNGTTVWLQICPEGTATGAKVEQFEADVDQFNLDLNADEDWVSGSFNYTGKPATLTTVTLA